MRYYGSSAKVWSRPRARTATRAIPISLILSISLLIFLLFSPVLLRSLERKFASYALERENELRIIRNAERQMMIDITKRLISIEGKGKGRRIYIVTDPAEPLMERWP